MESLTLGSERVKGRRTQRCRLCMKNAEKYLSLFVSNEAFRMSIGQAIEDLLIIQVAEDDGLPGTACRSCVRKLIEFRDFKEMVVHSATELRKYTLDIAITSPVKDEASHVLLMDEGKVINCSNRVLNESSGMTILNDTRDPLALENLVDEKEVSAVEPHAGQEGSEEESLLEKEYCGGQLVYIESAPLEYGNECRIKEEAVPMEPIASVEYDRGEDIDEEDFPVNTVSNMDSDPLDVGHMVSGSYDTVEHRKNCVKNTSVNNISSKVGGPEIPQNLLQETMTFDSSYEEHTRRNKSSFSPASLLANATVQESRRLTHSQQECLNSSLKVNEESQNGCQLRHELRGDRLEYTCEDSRSFKCHICNKGFRLRSVLADHLKVHTDVRPFACNTCGKGFNRKGHLRVHLNVHAGVRPFQCNMCEKGFFSPDTFKKHVARHSAMKPFKCQTCGKAFKFNYVLDSHLKTHAGVKQYKCDVCDKRFAQKSHLLSHVNVHMITKPFQCNACGKGFVSQGSLRRHAVVHSDLKPFQCKMCDRSFNQRSHLQGHMNMHLGIKFQCSTCGKSFWNENDLRKHSLVHSSVKPFVCQLCGKGFKQNCVLTRHLKIHGRKKI